MKMLTRLAQNLHSVARGIEMPHSLGLRRRGGSIQLFQKLSQQWLRNANITTILDIGANIGQFSIVANAVFPNADIYAFEPLPECFAELRQRFTNVSRLTAYNIGLGEEAGELKFERNAFAPSSSFLEMTEAHKSAFPYTRDTRYVSVEVERLDTIASQIGLRTPIMVKIDVQGYEERVLRGGEQTIRQAKIVIVETSFERLYHGQALFDDIYHIMTKWGFVYGGSLDQLHNPSDGRILQGDSIFLK